MNESVIRDSTPSGSAIVAYGKTRSPKLFAIILPLLAGLMLLFVTGIVLRTFFGATLPLPPDVAMLAYLSPSTALPDDSPLLWKETKRYSTSLPFLVGIRVDAQGNHRPFGIAVRSFRRDTSQTAWIWRLVQDEAAPFERHTPRSLVTTWKDYAAPLWLRVWPQRLFPYETSAPNADRSIGGTVTSNRWITDLPVPTGGESYERILSKNFIHIRSLPESWTILEPSLSLHDFNFRLKTAPSAIRWSFDNDKRLSLALDFQESLDTELKAQLAGSAGLFEHRAYTLPDGVVVTENRLPLTLVAGTTTNWALQNRRHIVFSEKSALLGNPDVLSQESRLPQGCQGRVLAAFNANNILSLWDNLNLSSLIRFEQLAFLEEKGRLVVCW